ncbi:MAG: hypothetical protein ACI9WS_001041 [Paraglaciecola psychrophila]|jgi:hypothetical protein
MNSSTDLIKEFKDYYKVLHNSDLSQLRNIYSSDVLFKDPVHEICGLVELEDYFTSMCDDLTDCRFEYLDELVSDHSAYIKWIMHFKHPKLRNRLVSVRGVSHIKIGEKIELQEDFYDMGAMLYEQLPLLGNVTRWLRQRLTN